MKKLLIFWVLLGILITALSACGKKEPDGEVTEATQGDPTVEATAPETDKWGQEVVYNDIPEDLDYDGAKVNIMIRHHEQYRREWCMDEITTALDNEVYLRNERVQDRLGITLNYLVTEEDTISTEVLKVWESGMSGVDIVSNYQAFGNSMTLMGCYADLNDAGFTYMNFNQPYWNQKYIDMAETYGKLYLVVGDVNLSVYDRAIAVYFNETLCTANGITGLYELALSGGWTYEVLYQYVQDFALENQTGDRSKQTFVFSTAKVSEGPSGMFGAFGLNFINKNADGTHSMVDAQGLTHLETACEMVYQLFSEAGSYIDHEVTKTMVDMFTEGRAMFSMDVIYHYAATNAQIRDMDDMYGLLPAPKYNSDQKEYLSAVQNAHNVMSVMDNGTQDFEMLSAVLESMCADNYTNVRPYYFERIVKLQYFREANAGKVFDLVLAGTYWDYSEIYRQSISSLINNVWFGPAVYGGSLETAFVEYRGSIETELETLDVWFLTQ